jgi:hypothetical protein
METEPAEAPGTAALQAVTVYLIALEDAGAAGPAVGCGDSAVPVEMLVPPAEDPVRAALEALFSIRQPDYAGRYNALHQSSLRVESVELEAGQATVYLSGSLLSGGACDDPRIVAQLQETALHFPEIETVTIYVNDRLLEDWFSR